MELVRPSPNHDVMTHVLDAFCFEGAPLTFEELPGGHIHDNLLVRCTGGRYVVQRINEHVFPRPETLLANVEHVAAHLHARGRACPRLVDTRDGELSFQAKDGSWWRAFVFLEGTRECAQPPLPVDAYEAGRIFADYLAALTDLTVNLAPTIEGFHDLGRRRKALEESDVVDRVGRRSSVRRETERARRLGQDIEEQLAPHLGKMPARTVHNDAKLANVRFDTRSGLAHCVVDLDTTMVGLVLFDLGELVRTATTHAPEDAREDTVDFDLELLAAVADGYLNSFTDIDSSELDALALAGPAMAIENAMRFLTDYLDGDRYFAVSHPAHNLVRGRAQIRLAELMLEAHAEAAGHFARVGRRPSHGAHSAATESLR
jgi:N-acetylhexosamine 1-kinase